MIHHAETYFKSSSTTTDLIFHFTHAIWLLLMRSRYIQHRSKWVSRSLPLFKSCKQAETMVCDPDNTHCKLISCMMHFDWQQINNALQLYRDALSIYMKNLVVWKEFVSQSYLIRSRDINLSTYSSSLDTFSPARE